MGYPGPLWDPTGGVDPWGGAHVGLHGVHAGGEVCLEEALEGESHVFPDGP